MMSDIRTKLRTRLLSTEFEAWNNPQRARAMLPVLIILGGGVGVLIQTHATLDDVPLPVLWTVFTFLGYAMLAVVN